MVCDYCGDSNGKDIKVVKSVFGPKACSTCRGQDALDRRYLKDPLGFPESAKKRGRSKEPMWDNCHSCKTRDWGTVCLTCFQNDPHKLKPWLPINGGGSSQSSQPGPSGQASIPSQPNRPQDDRITSEHGRHNTNPTYGPLPTQATIPQEQHTGYELGPTYYTDETPRSAYNIWPTSASRRV
jgi:hypothetical protein